MAGLFERLPKYIQIKEAIREDIEQNTLHEGDQLPSESVLIERFKASKMTVIRALQELVQEGYLRRVQGKGTYVMKPRPSSPSISVLLPDDLMDGGWQMMRGIESRASELGYDINLCLIGASPAKAELFIERAVISRSVGVIAAPYRFRHAESDVRRWINKTLKARIPLVFLVEGYEDAPEASCIGFTHRQGMMQLTRGLIDSGCKRLLLAVDWPNQSTYTSSLIEGFRQSAYSGIDTVEWAEVCELRDFSDMPASANRLIELIERRRPDAVIGGRDGLILSLRQESKALDLLFENGLVCAGFGGCACAEACGMMTYKAPWEEMGREAVMQLANTIRGGSPTAKLLEGQLVEYERAHNAKPASDPLHAYARK